MLPVLRYAKQCLGLHPTLIVLDALVLPCDRQPPAQYGCLYGERVGDLCLVAAPDSGLPWYREYRAQYGQLFEYRLHALGGSQNK